MGKRNETTRRILARQSIGCAAAALHPVPPDETPIVSPSARVVVTRTGTPWLVTVVARVASEDVETGAISGRLILRFESMSRPVHSTRIVTARAVALDELDDPSLRSLLSARTRSRSARA